MAASYGYDEWVSILLTPLHTIPCEMSTMVVIAIFPKCMQIRRETRKQTKWLIDNVMQMAACEWNSRTLCSQPIDVAGCMWGVVSCIQRAAPGVACFTW